MLRFRSRIRCDGPGVRNGGMVFTPASLFTASEAGFWADVTTARLWQDVARTTAVTAAGQSVASWALTTAAGTIYAEQSVAGSQPVYQVDGSGRGYLNFDGVDDFLQTALVDFSLTDKMMICVGLRKNADTLRGMAVELGNGATNGMRLEAPHTDATDTYRYTSGGTLGPGVASTAGFAAPITSVVTGLGDIANDVAVLRVNGTQLASAATDQGTGNYANAAVFFGRQGGTLLPFSGRIYGIIFRGAATSGSNLTNAERWVNSRTGAFA